MASSIHHARMARLSIMGADNCDPLPRWEVPKEIVGQLTGECSDGIRRGVHLGVQDEIIGVDAKVESVKEQMMSQGRKGDEFEERLCCLEQELRSKAERHLFTEQLRLHSLRLDSLQLEDQEMRAKHDFFTEEIQSFRSFREEATKQFSALSMDLASLRLSFQDETQNRVKVSETLEPFQSELYELKAKLQSLEEISWRGNSSLQRNATHTDLSASVETSAPAAPGQFTKAHHVEEHAPTGAPQDLIVRGYPSHSRDDISITVPSVPTVAIVPRTPADDQHIDNGKNASPAAPTANWAESDPASPGLVDRQWLSHLDAFRNDMTQQICQLKHSVQVQRPQSFDSPDVLAILQEVKQLKIQLGERSNQHADHHEPKDVPSSMTYRAMPEKHDDILSLTQPAGDSDMQCPKNITSLGAGAGARGHGTWQPHSLPYGSFPAMTSTSHESTCTAPVAAQDIPAWNSIIMGPATQSNFPFALSAVHATSQKDHGDVVVLPMTTRTVATPARQRPAPAKQDCAPSGVEAVAIRQGDVKAAVTHAECLSRGQRFMAEVINPNEDRHGSVTMPSFTSGGRVLAHHHTGQVPVTRALSAPHARGIEVKQRPATPLSEQMSQEMQALQSGVRPGSTENCRGFPGIQRPAITSAEHLSREQLLHSKGLYVGMPLSQERLTRQTSCARYC